MPRVSSHRQKAFNKPGAGKTRKESAAKIVEHGEHCGFRRGSCTVLRTSSDRDEIEDRLPAIDDICLAVGYYHKGMVVCWLDAFS